MKRLNSSGLSCKGDIMVIFLIWDEGLWILKPSGSSIFQYKQKKTFYDQIEVIFFLPKSIFYDSWYSGLLR